ncbi:hypothetical protein Mgra_00000137 [Meloidogyne graminicola]|uniref:Uncharacterized protein n=1 Tax=Meloidogyne graminicola TaxID=189291 RepID=A0A8T0A399_9BILA|nr:hypothetical protein Mgra_00000137 [Meloidogyne graminicola]
MPKHGNSFSTFKEVPIIKEKLKINHLNNKIMFSLFSFGLLKSTKFTLNFYLIIAIILLIGNNKNFIYAKEIRTSLFQLNPQTIFNDEFNGIQQFQRTYSNNLEFFKRNNYNNLPSLLTTKYSLPQKRRLVVRVPFASQNPDGSQLSRIYKQLFEPTATRTKKQPWSPPIYQHFVMKTKENGQIY